MPKYYLITLKNARAFEARDVRLNGLPLASLHTIGGPGRLEFVAGQAVPAGGRNVAIGFKSLSGMDSEFEIADPAVPGRRRRLAGRVTAAVPRPASAAGEYEQVTFIFTTIS